MPLVDSFPQVGVGMAACDVQRPVRPVGADVCRARACPAPSEQHLREELESAWDEDIEGESTSLSSSVAASPGVPSLGVAGLAVA
jgi:hypothetical protein